MGKHDSKRDGDGKWDNPVPPPDTGGSGGGKHEGDGKDEDGKDK